ncbi:hypothetical protein [Streptomyces sp. NPDC001165]|uniref:hypothetical protein n=1 Tax=Streptomyces sp. NPDC001165 TaxID=3364546 RepID=UPI003678F920
MTGLGDVFALAARVLGIEPGPGCGCHHRRDLLNKMFPFPRWLRGAGRRHDPREN